MILRLKRTPGIYLVGFMACGKSTIGRLLAEELGWRFADLDDDITAAEHNSIASIFDERGEEEFRRIERAALEKRVREVRLSKPLVLALGGGAFAQTGNRELLLSSGISIWLDCPFERIEKRVRNNQDRPLARDPEAFRKLFDSRREAYSLADCRVAIESEHPADAVRAIRNLPGLF
ncbi:MAG: shikimate kinase [Candidatus Solibacter usitatus]|nr:shikimate kinase [Candidatus Solibacter usitatus]